jgi:predicted RNA-binding protein Jag
MDYVETEGDSIDKAIENALKLLGVERDKITVDILSEGKKGILGFGAQKARIRATPRKSAIDWWRKKRRQWVRRRKKYWQRY